MNWFNEGREMAVWALMNPKEDTPECPWPIYAAEGIEWLKGWNSVVLDPLFDNQDSDGDDLISIRPQGSGNLFYPHDCA